MSICPRFPFLSLKFECLFFFLYLHYIIFHSFSLAISSQYHPSLILSTDIFTITSFTHFLFLYLHNNILHSFSLPISSQYHLSLILSSYIFTISSFTHLSLTISSQYHLSLILSSYIFTKSSFTHPLFLYPHTISSPSLFNCDFCFNIYQHIFSVFSLSNISLPSSL